MPTPLAVSGKGEEQRAAASLACLLCIQLGSGIESEEVFKTLKPIFKNILADGSANIQARQAVSVLTLMGGTAIHFYIDRLQNSSHCTCCCVVVWIFLKCLCL